MIKNKRVEIGYVAVDSGQLMVGDPCYLKDWKDTEFSERDEKKAGEYSYEGACNATLSEEGAGQLRFKGSRISGAGVVFSSGYGDGSYPVFATYNDEGRIIKVEVLMD